MFSKSPCLIPLVSLFLCVTITTAASISTCKTTPSDIDWPIESAWAALNASIDGTLIKTLPPASSCYVGNPFNSTNSCESVGSDWGFAAWQAAQPEGIDYPIYGNNSCLPLNATGYIESRGCSIGASPQYVVNATTEQQIATALAWASRRNLRIVIKGTVHDMNGRSTGAYSMSIWTHNFLKMEFKSSWPLPSGNGTADVLIVGSGNNLEAVYTAAQGVGRSIVGGDAKTVGLGGFIQGGGHGPLSSQFGLAADQIYQATVITTEGKILIANSDQNQDLLWAIRGGGPGQYGVVTEYVLKAHPAPSNVLVRTILMSPVGTDNAAAEAAWKATAVLLSQVPDIMDAGLAGIGSFATGKSAMGYLGLSAVPAGVAFSVQFFGYSTNVSAMDAILEPVVALIQAQGGNGTLSVTYKEAVEYATYLDFFNAGDPTPDPAGQISLMSSRLLGRVELSETPIETVAEYMEKMMISESGTGGIMIAGMQGGPGPSNVAVEMRGALNPVWRKAYIHAIALTGSINATEIPKTALATAANWLEENTEAVWREWAPDTGAYINEANCFSSQWKHDFYGVSYDKLVAVKAKYDPTESLWIQSGVGSDLWDYDLNSGNLCRV